MGIGTSAPTQALDVNGQARVRALQADAAGQLVGLAADGTLQAQSPVFSTAAPAFLPTPPADLGAVAASNTPQAIVLDPAHPRAYVIGRTSSIDGQLDAYDLGLNGLPVRRGTVPTGRSPRALAVHPAGTRLYVTNTTDNTLQTFDISGGGLPASLGTVPTGRNPVALAVNPTGTRLYVTNLDDNRLQTYDITGGGLPVSLGVVRTGRNPVALAVPPAGTRAYVLNYSGNTLQAFDLSGSLPVSLDSIGTTGSPTALAVNTAGTRAYVVSPYNNLDTYNLNGSALVKIGSAYVAFSALGVVLDPTGARAYVLQYAPGNLRIYDLNGGGIPISLANTGPLARPTAMAINPAGTRAYITTVASTLYTFDLGSSPRPLAVSAGGAAASLGATPLPGAGRLPAAYGAVGSGGAALGAASGFAVTHPATGVYRLSFTSSPLSTTDLNQAATVATLAGVAPGSVSYRTGRGYVEVLTYAPGGTAFDRGFTFSVTLP